MFEAAARESEVEELELLELLPASSVGVVKLDLVRLRGSPHYGTLADTLAAFTELEPIRTREIFDHADEVAVGLVRGTDGVEFGTVLLRAAAGSTWPEELVAFLQSTETVRELGTAVAVDSRTLRVGNQPETPTELSEALGDAVRSLEQNGAMLALAFAPEESERAALAQSLRVFPPENENDLVAIGFGMNFAPGLELRVFAETTNAEVATHVAQLATAQIDTLRSHFMVSLLGLGPLVEAARVAPAGTQALLQSSLSESDTDQLLDRREELIELARALSN